MSHAINQSCAANISTCSQASKPALNGQGVAKESVESAPLGSKVSETQVSITYQNRSSSLSWGSSTASYQQIQDVAVSDQPANANNAYSTAILGAIETQLKRDLADGASAEELASRLQAGWTGFQQGYAEALQQLEALAEFTPDVKAQIEETYSQVAQGIAELAEHLGVDSPVAQNTQKEHVNGVGDTARVAQTAEGAASPVQSRQDVRAKLSQQVMSSVMRDYALVEQLTRQRAQQTEYYEASTYTSTGTSSTQRYAYAVSEARSFDFGLTTQDGDEVTLKFSADKLGFTQFSTATESSSQLLQFGAQSSNFSFSVEGELDSDELEAIQKLLKQVGEISQFFFEGDMTNAIELAKAIEFDASEINVFDVHLGRSTTEIAAVETTSKYNSLPLETRQNSNLLDNFVDKIDLATQLVESLGKPKSLVADLADWVAQSSQPRNPWSAHVGAIVKGFL